MKIALDTNILVYAEGVNGSGRSEQVWSILEALPSQTAVIPVQVLGELFNVLVRKAGKPPKAARLALMSWRDAFGVVETSPEVMMAASDLATDHQLSIWDAVILAAASQSGCRVLLSEDLQDGFTWGGTTVVNPFAEPPDELLLALSQPR